VGCWRESRPEIIMHKAPVSDPVTETVLAPQARRRALTAVLASLTAAGLTFGTSFPLFSVLLDRAGESSSIIGLHAAMPILGTIVTAPFIPFLIRRLGVQTTMFGSLAMIVVCYLLFPILPSLSVWFVLRFMVGVGMAVHWIVSETWLNAAATSSRRGLYAGLYATLMSIGFAVGPALLTVIDLDTALPFVIIAGSVVMVAIPLYWARNSMPAIEPAQSDSHLWPLAAAPTIFLASLVAGVVDAAVLSLLAVYGIRTGFNEADALILLTVLGVGTVTLQLPLGWLADRVGRRRLLMLSGVAGAAGAMALPLALGLPSLLWVILFLWGGFVVGLYTIALAELGERFQGPALAGANGLFVMAYSAGSLGGPPALGVAMDVLGPNGLPLGLAAACLLFLLVAAVRTMRWT
jgi:MFS family permease